MNNIVTTNTNTEVVVVTAPGPSGPVGPQGPQGDRGTVAANSGFLATPFLDVSGSMTVTGSSTFSGDVTITGSLIVSSSNTFLNIGPALFTGSVGVSGSLTATLFSGSGAGLTGIPASGITGLNLSRIATGAVSASVSTGLTAFTLNTGGTNLFTVSNSGLGTFSSGLIVNGVTVLSGTATLNGSAILTTATVSTSRISDSNISASVSSTGKAFNVSNGATSLMSVDQNGAISGSGLYVSGSAIYIDGPTIRLYGNATLNNAAITTTATTTTDRIQSGTVTASVATFGNAFTLREAGTTIMNVSTAGQVSASSFIGDGSQLTNVGIIYNSGSNPLINSIQVADFDNNVAVTFVDGNLKFVFGTPIAPTTPSLILSGFETNRFNKQFDSYNAVANWDVGGYTLESAKLYYTVTGELLASTTTGTSFNIEQTTTGSGQSYRVEITSSSPLDGTVVSGSFTRVGNLSKTDPAIPNITITNNTVQLGISGLQIEEGATGDISFSTSYGSDNGWSQNGLTSIPSTSPQTISTATDPVTISATSNYISPLEANDPDRTISKSSTVTYSRIRSLRYGASTTTIFSRTDLQNLTNWLDNIGSINKGQISPSGQTISITWSGDKYQYIIYNSSEPDLTNIASGGAGGVNTLPLWTKITNVTGYKIYRTTSIQAGGAGRTVTYALATQN